MVRRSEPYVISDPPRPYPHAFVSDGLVHVAWRRAGLRMQMACGCEAAAWTFFDKKKLLPPVTCLWCVVGFLPWLHWSPFDA